MTMSEFLRITGLFLRKGPKGTFMVGNVNSALSLFIFKNEKKQAENDPDYYACWGAGKKKDESSHGQQRPTKGQVNQNYREQMSNNFHSSQTSHASPSAPASQSPAPAREPGDESESADPALQEGNFNG